MGPREKKQAFVACVSQVGRESGFAWGRRSVHRDFWGERIGTAVVRVAGLEIEADGCPSRVRRPYKTTGFAPKVPYFAPLPLRSETSTANRPSLSCPHRHRRSAYVRVAAAVKLMPALPPYCFNGVVGQIKHHLPASGGPRPPWPSPPTVRRLGVVATWRRG